MLLLFGGSFNPPHVGHLRAAVEVVELLRPARAMFLPCSVPPHKGRRGLLPFAFRCELIRAALDDLGEAGGCFELCTLEGERSGPSYTIDTLRALGGLYPEMRPAFVLGCEEYAGMAHWPGRKEFPLLADILVLARHPGAEAVFMEASRKLWPGAQPLPHAGGRRVRLPGGGSITLVSPPKMEISATRVRQRFLDGASLELLLSPSVLRLLRAHEGMAREAWGAEGAS